MANTVRCPNCGRDVPRPSSPDARCPACHKPLQVAPAGAYEDLELGPEVETASSSRPITRPGLAAEPAAPRRPQTESSLAASRMANAPTFKSGKPSGGLPVLPIAAGVVLILAVTVFALTRGKPATPEPLARPPADLQVTTVGRPPEPATPPVVEQEPEAPVVTKDLPDATPSGRERRKAAERDAARAGRPAAREVARTEKPAPAAKAPAPARTEPKAEPRPEPKVEAKSEPAPPPPPPQFVAAAPQAPPPTASAPLAIGPSYAREGYQKARQKVPTCVRDSIRLPRDILDAEGETATVKFAVDETGKVSQFSYLSGPDDPRISNAIWTAVQRCEWIPGATAQGRALTLWVTMPIKFGK